MMIVMEHFAKFTRSIKKTFLRTGGTWISSPFTSWKNFVERMKVHEKCDTRVQGT